LKWQTAILQKRIIKSRAVKSKPSLTRRRKRAGDDAEPGRIIRSDALVALRKIAAGSVQLVIADPPYFQVLNRAWD